MDTNELILLIDNTTDENYENDTFKVTGTISSDQLNSIQLRHLNLHGELKLGNTGKYTSHYYIKYDSLDVENFFNPEELKKTIDGYINMLKRDHEVNELLN